MSHTYHQFLFPYSVTCHTNDLAVFHCLRALGHYADPGAPVPDPEHREHQWRNAGNKLTLCFSSPAYRNKFKDNARRILPQTLWSVVRESDEVPESALNR